jgi:hypothetical protein
MLPFHLRTNLIETIEFRNINLENIFENEIDIYSYQNSKNKSTNSTQLTNFILQISYKHIDPSNTIKEIDFETKQF